jgi:hypothetical protein
MTSFEFLLPQPHPPQQITEARVGFDHARREGVLAKVGG